MRVYISVCIVPAYMYVFVFHRCMCIHICCLCMFVCFWIGLCESVSMWVWAYVSMSTEACEWIYVFFFKKKLTIRKDFAWKMCPVCWQWACCVNDKRTYIPWEISAIPSILFCGWHCMYFLRTFYYLQLLFAEYKKL